MKLKLVTAAVLGLLATTTFAAPTLYGEIDASIDYLPEKNATKVQLDQKVKVEKVEKIVQKKVVAKKAAVKKAVTPKKVVTKPAKEDKVTVKKPAKEDKAVVKKTISKKATK